MTFVLAEVARSSKSAAYWTLESARRLFDALQEPAGKASEVAWRAAEKNGEQGLVVFRYAPIVTAGL